MDVVIPVRAGDPNPELRYALRSIAAHLPHDRVVIVGHCPDWVTGVLHIPTVQNRDRRANATRNLLESCLRDDLSHDVIVTWDDVYLMRGFDPLPTWNAGLVTSVIATSKGGYRDGLLDTLARLTQEGVTDAIAYDGLHRPQVFDRHDLAEIIKDGWPMPFTAYGNLVRWPKGDTVSNAKTLDGWQGRDVLSTSDKMWFTHPMAAHVRATFTEPCRYEHG